MADPKPITVTGLPRSFMAEDASLVQLHFGREKGQPIVLQLSAGVFDLVVSRLTHLLSGLHLQKGATSGLLEIHAAPVAAITAEAPIGGGKVILGVRTDNGLVNHFSLTLEQANETRVGLLKAEMSAREQGSKTRQ